MHQILLCGIYFILVCFNFSDDGVVMTVLYIESIIEKLKIYNWKMIGNYLTCQFNLQVFSEVPYHSSD